MDRGEITKRIRAGGRFVISEFAPLIAFWLLSWAFSVKIAIAGSIATMEA
jgi:hypothetical protein